MEEQPKLSERLSFLICIVALLLPAYVFGEINRDFLITVDDAEKVIGKPDWVILDCRAQKLYNAGHIKGAVTLGDSCRFILKDGTQRINLDVLGKMSKAIDKLAKEIYYLKKENAQLKKGGAESKTMPEEDEAWMNPLEESGCGLAEE